MVSERETVLAIRRILDRCGGLTMEARRLREGDDLFTRGLTGLAAVDVLLAVETTFGVIFPPAMMCRQTVASIEALASSLRSLEARSLAA